MRDLFNRISGQSALLQITNNTATVNGSAIDLLLNNDGYEGLTFIITSAGITDGTHTFTLQDSPDNSTWTNVAAPYVQYQASNAFTSASASGTVMKIGYLGNAGGASRYVRLVVTVTSPTTGGKYVATAVLGHSANLPTA